MKIRIGQKGYNFDKHFDNIIYILFIACIMQVLMNQEYKHILQCHTIAFKCHTKYKIL